VHQSVAPAAIISPQSVAPCAVSSIEGRLAIVRSEWDGWSTAPTLPLADERVVRTAKSCGPALDAGAKFRERFRSLGTWQPSRLTEEHEAHVKTIGGMRCCGVPLLLTPCFVAPRSGNAHPASCASDSRGFASTLGHPVPRECGCMFPSLRRSEAIQSAGRLIASRAVIGRRFARPVAA